MEPETRRKLLIALCRNLVFWTYCICGAFIFMAIEGNSGDADDESGSIYKQIKKNLTAKYNINETAFDELTRELKHASQFLYSDRSDWSFGNSMLFVQSIITTIGYGHIVPVTVIGRLFCIIYAIFGIPICLAMLAIMGDLLRLTHMKWIQRFENFDLISLSCDAKCAIVCCIQMVVLIFIGAGIHMKVDNWTFDEGIYAWFITFSTIGFGDYIPGYHYIQGDFGIQHSILIYRIFFDIFGLCVVVAFLSSLARIFQNCIFQRYCFLLPYVDTHDESEDHPINNERHSIPLDEIPETSNA